MMYVNYFTHTHTNTHMNTHTGEKEGSWNVRQSSQGRQSQGSKGQEKTALLRQTLFVSLLLES